MRCAVRVYVLIAWGQGGYCGHLYEAAVNLRLTEFSEKPQGTNSDNLDSQKHRHGSLIASFVQRLV